MGKSTSSSLKKKRSKNSSQARKRKISKSKSKSKRYKSKKAHRREDSLSYSSDDDSRSLVSVPSFSSEDGYRSRKSRSRTRKDVKGSKKKVQRRSSSSESIEDSSRVRKRKGSKRNDDFEVRKKGHLKKKARRDDSVSYMSSGSRSCSTCRSESNSSSDEREYEKRRGRSERKEKDRRKLEKVKSGSKRREDRSRSFSSGSRHIEGSDHWSDERVTVESNSRRLRSVITVTEGGMEGREFYKDENKEEMVYDQDDYPSCRSNDSNDGVSKRELTQHSNVASEKKGHIEVEKGETVVSNIRRTKVMDSEDRYDGSACAYDVVEKNDAVKEKKSEVSGAVGSLNGDDLESILRQRALENLRRFRGGLPTSAKTPSIEKDLSDSYVQQPSPAKARLDQIKPPKEDSARVGATQVVERISMPVVQNDSTRLSRNDEKMSDRKDGRNESGSAKQDVVCPPDWVAVAGNPNKKVNASVGSITYKPNFPPSVWRRQLSNTHATPKQVPASHEPPQAKLVTHGSVDKSDAETAQTVTLQSGNSNDVSNAFGSASGEPSSLLKSTSDKIQDEAKEGSQFEEKKMSVMRGGEMVEVSYKVYIPKKAPALARRQFNRGDV